MFITISFVSSTSVSSEINEGNTLIIGNSNEATYNLEIINNQQENDRFTILTSEEYWSWSIQAEPSILDVNKGTKENFLLKIKPAGIIEAREYTIPLTIKSTTNESIILEEEIKVTVTSYENAINLSLRSQENINPNEETLFKIDLKNNYNLKINNLKLVLESEFFSTSQDLNLSYSEETTKDFLVDFVGSIEEGEHEINVKIYSIGDLVLEKSYTMDIGDFPNLEGSETPIENFLFSSETIVKTNNGNSILHETYTKELTSFENFITITSPEPTSKTKVNNKYILSWEFDLNPGETKTITIEKDYRKLMFWLIGIVIIFGLFYTYRKRDISITKDVLSIKQSKDGVLSMDLVVSLKNKSRRNLKNLKLLDTIGHLVDTPSHFGSREPKIIKSNGTTRMLWDIPILRGRSNFVVSYNVKIKHHRISSLVIPMAVAKYIKLGKRKIVYSNTLRPFLK
tara:strand:- start:1102 stop:2469 length:1368 start_codon:yes stop_codon:yes gene_type:complete